MSQRYQTPEDRTRAAPVRPPIREGRELSGMSQEDLAEYLRIDPRTLRRYEAGEIPTPDNIMLEVAELPNVPTLLLYKHFRQKYRIPDDMMPAVDAVPVAVAVIHLLREIRKWEATKGATMLLDMADNGTIDPEEEKDFAFVMEKLEGICKAVAMLKYSEKGRGGICRE